MWICILGLVFYFCLNYFNYHNYIYQLQHLIICLDFSNAYYTEKAQT